MFRLFLFFIFFIGCKNYIDIDSVDYCNSFNGLNNSYIINKSKKIYTLNKPLIIPKNKVLIISDGVKINIKNNAEIINNGTLIIGENKNNDSLNLYNDSNFNNLSFSYNTAIYSKNIFFLKSEGESLIINNSYLENINIISINNINLNNTVLIKSLIEIKNSDVSIINSYFNKTNFKIYNSSFILKNSFLIKNKLLELINNNKIIINNCFIYNTYGFLILKNSNINYLNNIFYKNKNCIDLDIYINNYCKSHNNIFIENENIFNKKDSSLLYIINNTFDKNKKVFNKIKNDNYIIPKNNIYYYSYLNNYNIKHSHCLSNKEILKGYFNLNKEPLFKDIENYNYNLNLNSPALRSGNNNINLGANINTIYSIKYLK